MRINRNNGNKSLQGLKQGQGLDHKDKDKDLTHKDHDKDKDLTPKDQDKDKDLTPKNQDKDKDLKNVLKESLRTRTRINNLKSLVLSTELLSILRRRSAFNGSLVDVWPISFT